MWLYFLIHWKCKQTDNFFQWSAMIFSRYDKPFWASLEVSLWPSPMTGTAKKQAFESQKKKIPGLDIETWLEDMIPIIGHEY